jgi:hypothetical protein
MFNLTLLGIWGLTTLEYTKNVYSMYSNTQESAAEFLGMELMNHDVSSRGKDDGLDKDTGGGAGNSGSTTASRSMSRWGPPSETSSQEWDKLADPRI